VRNLRSGGRGAVAAGGAVVGGAAPLRLICKHVGVGQRVDLGLALRVQSCMTNVEHWWRPDRPTYEVRVQRAADRVGAQLCDDLEATALFSRDGGGRYVELRLPQVPPPVLGNGFLTTLTKPPAWRAAIALRPPTEERGGDEIEAAKAGPATALLWCGAPPRVVEIRCPGTTDQWIAVDVVLDEVPLATRLGAETIAARLKQVRTLGFDPLAINTIDAQSLLMMLQRCAVELKVAAVAGRPTTAGVAFLRAIVSHVSAAFRSDRSVAALMALPPDERAQRMKTVKQLLNDIATVSNDVDVTSRSLEATLVERRERANGDGASGDGNNNNNNSGWLRSTSSLKHSKQILRRTGRAAAAPGGAAEDVEEAHEEFVRALLNEVRGIAAVAAGESTMTAEEEEECAAFGAAAPVSILSGGSTRSHGCAMEALATRYSAEGAERGLPTMSTALQSCAMVGLLVRVDRANEAMAVDPWAIRVTHVSRDWADTTNALCHASLGAALDDADGDACTDIVPLLNPAAFAGDDGEVTPGGSSLASADTSAAVMRSKLLEVYAAVVFTRNPALRLPQQRIALLMVSFVRSVEQLIRTTANVFPSVSAARATLSLSDEIATCDAAERGLRAHVDGALLLLYSVRAFAASQSPGCVFLLFHFFFCCFPSHRNLRCVSQPRRPLQHQVLARIGAQDVQA
jgi:hypothetical protein